MEIEEIRVKLPLCEIAGKWYGSKRKRPIILVHGWQDNAGTFATLIPLLSADFSYFAFDLPGHGLSSHLPKGWNYNVIYYIMILEQLRQQFKWKKISLIAHSIGAAVSFMYAASFPDKVDSVCALDILKPQKLPMFDLNHILKSIKYSGEDSKPLPDYSYEELPDRIHEGTRMSISKRNAKYLIERGVRRKPDDPNRFCFTRDIRAKLIMVFEISHETTLELIEHIEAAYLFIKGSDRFVAEPEENLVQAVDQFRRFNKPFEMVRVRGSHHFHLNHPEQIAFHINKFLKKYYIPDEKDFMSKL